MMVTDILPRAKAIRLPISEIARRTSLDKHTVLRIDDDGRSPLATTREAVLAAIVADETRLRDYLIGLHPVPAAESRDRLRDFLTRSLNLTPAAAAAAADAYLENAR